MKKVLIGILIGLIVGLGCLFVYNEFFLKNNDATKTDKKEAVKKEEVKEEKITDETIIKQLNENVGILSNYCYAGSKMCIENLYEEDKVTYISDIDKATVVLLSLTDQFKSLNINRQQLEYGIGRYNTYIENIIGGGLQIDKSVVENKYYNLFGEKLPEGLIETQKACPIFIFDDTNKLVYLIYDCGGVALETPITYNNKYTKEENKYYVYQSVGIYDKIDGKIYKDTNGTIYKENQDSEFKIDSSNYKDFSEYKYTFNFKDGNYYFESIEKIS